MRELKFRCWDTKKKEMVVTGFSIIGEITVFDMLQTWGGSVSNLNDLVIMQFTGLLDKEGKECYEGDVVRYAMTYPVGSHHSWQNGWVGTVYYDTRLGGWYVTSECKDGADHEFHLQAATAKNFEKIGNSLQNPTLLEGGA